MTHISHKRDTGVPASKPNTEKSYTPLKRDTVHNITKRRNEMSKQKLLQELHEAMVACLISLGKSRTYEDTKQRYNRLKKEIDERLLEMDALCLDSERYIDRKTGGIRTGLGVDLVEELTDKLKELGGLLVTLDLFEREEHWSDNAMNNFSNLILISSYESIEKRITDEHGLFHGRQLILEVKREILPMETELGLSHFREEVEILEGLIRTMTLFTREGDLDLERPDNLDEKDVNLINLLGEYLRYKTVSKLTLGNKCYIELERLDEIRARTFAYYLAESHGQGERLTLVEDRELEKKLDALRDRLDAAAGR